MADSQSGFDAGSGPPPGDRYLYDAQGRRITTVFAWDEWRPTEADITTYTYDYKYKPPDGFEHDKEKGLLRFIGEDGRQETFRDKPTRYLVVWVDPETGEPRPVMSHGAPEYLYLCREEREIR